MSKASEQEKAAAVAQLREWLAPGDTVHTILRYIARSGGKHVVSLILVDSFADGGGGSTAFLRRLDELAAKALGLKHDRNHNGLTFWPNGARDPGEDVVCRLSVALFGDDPEKALQAVTL